MYRHPNLDRSTLTPEQALDVLREGNLRFVQNQIPNKDYHSLVESTKDKQHPFCAFLSCSDSRAPVEMLFDQVLGDVFSVRLAGNIASDKAIGSLEFATKYLGSKLIVVLGHSGCGAVKAACDNFREGHIGEIINLIKPSIRHEKTVKDESLRNAKNSDFVEKICKLNVQYQIDTIVRSSDIVDDMLYSKQVGIIGAVYDIATGKVHFMEESFVGK